LDTRKAHLPKKFPHRHIAGRFGIGIAALDRQKLRLIDETWSGPMPNRIGSTLGKTLSKVLYATLTATVLTSGSAHGADDCLVAPNGNPPPGSHWYFFSDRARQRQCWYIGAENRRPRRAEPDAQSTTKATTLTSFEVERPLPPPRPAAAPPRAGELEGVEEIAPRTPQAQAFELQQAVPTDDGSEVVAVGQNVRADEAAPIASATATDGRTMLPMLIACAVAVAGILQYLIFHMLTVRPPPVRIERGRAGRIASLGSGKAAAPPPARPESKRPPVRPTELPEREEACSLAEGIQQLVRAKARAAA
jgi:hypothetical protein